VGEFKKIDTRRSTNNIYYYETWIEDNFNSKANRYESVSHTTHSPSVKDYFQNRVFDLATQCAVTLIKKQQDYGSKAIIDSPGGALNGILIRMHDKLSRANNLVFNKREPKNESLEDTFLDIIGYSLIAILVLRDQWGTDEKNRNHL
jgi:hypothetical protein